MQKYGSLREIYSAIGHNVPAGFKDATINNIAILPSQCINGSLYLADSWELRNAGYDNEEAAIRSAINNGAAAVITSLSTLSFRPSIPILVAKHPTQLATLLAAKAGREFQGQTIVITGSVGKTTTKDIIASVLGSQSATYKTQGSTNSLAGICQTIINTPPEASFSVIEVGASRRGHIANSALLSPDIGVITNIGLSHIGNYASLAELREEKLSLLDHLTWPGTAIIHESLLENPDYLALLSEKKKNISRLISFGTSPSSDAYCNHYNFSGARIEGRVSIFGTQYPFVLNLPSPHFISGALCALACAALLDLDIADCVEALEDISLTPRRFERFKIIMSEGKVELIDDSCNAAPASMVALLNALASRKPKRKILVWGDMLEMGTHAERQHAAIGSLVNAGELDLLITVGPQTHIATRTSINSEVVNCEDWDQAATFLETMIKSGDLIAVKGSSAMKLDRVANQIKKLGHCSAALDWTIENEC